jgi:aryl-alcohol dehydrogenase-like predicted oxidoreductase
MRALNQLIATGKVLYLGISDTPAWVVSKANEFARAHGLAPFVVYQGLWSASVRDFERDILPMCEAEQMGIAPWGVLGRGNFRPEAERAQAKTEGRNMGDPTETDLKISSTLEKIAKRKDTAITSIAEAYILHKYPYVFPIIGGRKVSHLKGNIAALSIELSSEDIKEIEGAQQFDAGFPHSFLFRGAPWSTELTAKDNFLTKTATTIDVVSKQVPIKPRPLKQ